VAKGFIERVSQKISIERGHRRYDGPRQKNSGPPPATRGRAPAQGHGRLGHVPRGQERAGHGGFVRRQAVEEGRRSRDRRRRMIRIAVTPAAFEAIRRVTTLDARNEPHANPRRKAANRLSLEGTRPCAGRTRDVEDGGCVRPSLCLSSRAFRDRGARLCDRFQDYLFEVSINAMNGWTV
jgi:hypothetical protein